MTRFALRALGVALAMLLATSAASAPLFVTDDGGRTVHMKEPAKRIVALEPFLAELVFALGAGKQLVGVNGDSSYPPEVFRIAKVSATPSIFILEQLPIMKPDLVLAWVETIQENEIERISAAGPAVFVADARHLEDVPRVLKALGVLLGRGAADVIEAYERKLDDLRAANARKVPVNAFVELQHRPLTTVSAKHFLSEALEVCRATNVFNTQIDVTPKVSWEQVERRNPWAIVGFGSSSNEEEFRRNWNLRRGLRAVQAGNFVYIPSDVTVQPTTRTPDDIERICVGLDRVRP